MINVVILLMCSALAVAQTSLDVSITQQYYFTVPLPAYSSGVFGLVCSATSTSGPPTNVTWTSYPAGVVESLTTSGNTSSSRPLTLPSPVVLSCAGLYVCTASANGVSKTASYAFNITLNALSPPYVPAITAVPSQPPYYAGSSVSVTCTYLVPGDLGSFANVQLIWTGVNGLPPGSTVTPSSLQGVLYSTLTITTLSTSDVGQYWCTAWITLTPLSPYIIGANTSAPYQLYVTGLPLGVTISPTSLRSSSNSSFQINCSATKPASVSLPFVFTWSYKSSVLTFNSSGVATFGGTTFVMSQPPEVSSSTPNVTSTLTVSQSPSGVYTCKCGVMVNVPVDGPVNQTAQVSVYISGRGPPQQPTNITAIKVFMDTVSIQWTVPLIVYTQETYVVQYGSAPGHLGQSSNPVTGSADLNVIGGQFGANLTGLVPSSLYYYFVVASNTEGTTTTPVMNITFFPPDGVASLSVGSGDPSYISVTWRPPPPPNNDVIYYMVKTTPFGGGDVINSTNVSGLSVDLTGVYAPGVPYNASVTGVNILGLGKTTTAYGYTQELAPSGTLNIMVTSINGSTILLSWKPLSPVEARGFVRYYLVTWTPGTRGTRGTTGGGTVNLTADTTIFLITGLDPMVTYMVSVSAGTIAGVGATTNTTAMPTASAPTAVMTTSNILCGQLCIIIIVVVGGCVLLVLLVMVLIITVCACLRCRQKRRSVDLRMTDISQQQPDKKSASPDQLSSTDMDTMEPLNSYEMIKGGMAIPLSEFSAYVARNHMDRDKGFELEYQATSMEGTYPMESAALPCNKAKNRFHNISPYDHNRVCLSELDGEEGSDYINASYIDGYNQKRAYIVAQGPMPSTVRDFWRMVWQEQVNTIVMLTQCNEGGKRKCEQYWPDSVGGVNEPFPGLRVTLNDSMTFADYETRKMSITCNGSEPLEISHFQFLGWPDHGVPLYSTSLLGFIKRVRSEHRQDGSPLVVHCSAGVGRSGAFIILDYLMGSMSDAVNIQDCLAKLREQRASVVQTLAQYVFIHDALNELITCGDTQINASELAARMVKMREVDKNTNDTQSAFQDQFKLLEIVCHKPTSNDTSDARQDFNHDKNRYPDRVPYNRDRVRLKAIGVGVQGGEYINASFVDGYKARNAYIAAQAPLMNTVNDFWRMVWEFKSMTIVMLCGLDEQHGIVQFWPLRAGESYSLGKLSVSLESRSEEGYCYKLRLKDEKDSSQQLQVTLFCHPGWPEMECPGETKSVISIADSVVRAQMQCGNTNNKYITVVCNDGMGRTGAFITIHAMMERLKTEHVVDFFQFIKSSRVRRPNFVRSLEQYIYCHEVIADYVEMNVAYANFQDTSKPK